jgi:hypothetical protein
LRGREKDMRCKEIKNLLVPYYDNSLDPDEREKVKKHLAECDSCRLKLKEIEDTLGLLTKESVQQPEESFWTNFLPEVRSRIETERKPIFTLFPKPRLVFGLMSALVMVALSFFLLNMDPKKLMELRTDTSMESILLESDLTSSTDQLAEILSSPSVDSLAIDVFLSSEGEEELELTESILEEDYLSRNNLNTILSELSIQELKQIEESIKTLRVGDIL